MLADVYTFCHFFKSYSSSAAWKAISLLFLVILTLGQCDSGTENKQTKKSQQQDVLASALGNLMIGRHEVSV